MIRTIYLSYDGLTDPLGQSQVLPYIIGLKQKGYDVTIISFEKTSQTNREKIKSILSENLIGWIPLSYTKKPPILSTIWDIVKLNKTVKSLNHQSIDLIHCRSYITSIVALKIKIKYNIPFIFDMRGFYADERVDGKIWNKSNFIFKNVYKYFKRKEKEFLIQSNYTVSLTNTGKKEIESWKLNGQSPIEVIPCCTDEGLFQKENIKPVRKEFGLKENDFVLSYVGSIGTWYMLDEMLDFFKELKKKKENAKFLFITKDDPKSIISKASNKSINKDSVIIQASSREMMPSYIGASDFSIFFILPVFSKKASSPTKMGEIMNLGIPIVCNSGIGDVDEIMNECMPELLIKEFSSNEYQRVIDIILNDNKFDKKKIIETSHNYYSLEKGIEKYSSIYKKVLEQWVNCYDTSPPL